MACELAVAREGSILRGLVLGFDVGGELVEFVDRRVASSDRSIHHRLGIFDVLLDARAVGGVFLVEGGNPRGRRQLAWELRLYAVMRRYVGHGDGRGLSIDISSDNRKGGSERHGKKHAGDHGGPRERKAKVIHFMPPPPSGEERCQQRARSRSLAADALRRASVFGPRNRTARAPSLSTSRDGR